MGQSQPATVGSIHSTIETDPCVIPPVAAAAVAAAVHVSAVDGTAHSPP